MRHVLIVLLSVCGTVVVWEALAFLVATYLATRDDQPRQRAGEGTGSDGVIGRPGWVAAYRQMARRVESTRHRALSETKRTAW